MFGEKDIAELREKISSLMTGYRLEHTLGVERTALILSELYAPEKKDVLSAAALLHDITKEKSLENQLQICEKLGIIVPSENIASPKTMHALTAAAIIPFEYSAFAEKEVVSSVRWHTTGRKNMSLCEQIIYLADYIEDGRKFEDCVKLRDYFFSCEPEKMDEHERKIHLLKTLELSFEMTIDQLVKEGAVIHPDTVEAKNSISKELQKMLGYDNVE